MEGEGYHDAVAILYSNSELSDTDLHGHLVYVGADGSYEEVETRGLYFGEAAASKDLRQVVTFDTSQSLLIAADSNEVGDRPSDDSVYFSSEVIPNGHYGVFQRGFGERGFEWGVELTQSGITQSTSIFGMLFGTTWCADDLYAVLDNGIGKPGRGSSILRISSNDDELTITPTDLEGPGSAQGYQFVSCRAGELLLLKQDRHASWIGQVNPATMDTEWQRVDDKGNRFPFGLQFVLVGDALIAVGPTGEVTKLDLETARTSHLTTLPSVDRYWPSVVKGQVVVLGESLDGEDPRLTWFDGDDGDIGQTITVDGLSDALRRWHEVVNVPQALKSS